MAAYDRNAAHERQQIQGISANIARRLLSVLEKIRFAPAALASEIDAKAQIVSTIQRDIDQLLASQPAQHTLDIAVLTHVLGSQQHALALVEFLESKVADIGAVRPPPDQARTHAALLAAAREIEEESLRYALPPATATGYPRPAQSAPPPSPASFAPQQGQLGHYAPTPQPGPPPPAQRRLPPPGPPPGPQHARPPHQPSQPAAKPRPPAAASATDRLAAVVALASKPGPAAMLAVLGVMVLIGAVWWVLPQADKRFVSQSSATVDPSPKLDGRLAAGSESSNDEQGSAAAIPPMTFNAANATREMEQPYLVVLATRRSTDELQKEFLTYRATYPTLLGASKARVDRVQGQDRQTWYRLSVIPPQARDDAKALCSNLRAAGLTGCWIKPVPLN